MRLHLGLDIGDAQGRSAIVFVEHMETAPDEPGGRTGTRSLVSYQKEWPAGTPVEAIREGLVALMDAEELWQVRPVVLVNTAGGGDALVRALRADRREGRLRSSVRVHGYALHGGRLAQPGGISRHKLQTAVMESYLRGRLAFVEKLPDMEALVAALVRGAPAIDADGRSSLRLDHLAVALGLALAFPTHGDPPQYVERSGRIVTARRFTSEPY